MREIEASKIAQTVRDLCIRANYQLPADVEQGIRDSQISEPWPTAHSILDKILDNIEVARTKQLPLCQDTGMACIFLELGQDVHITGGSLYDAVNEGVRRGYREGFLRMSVVRDPLRRENTGDNTPAIIHTDIVPGDALKITVAPKGFGSENMSRIRMLSPSDGVKGVKSFVVEAVREAGPNPCPPIVVGVGIGSTFEGVALLAKKALLRPLDKPNPDAYYRALENALLTQINQTGIGPQGFGGKTTALKVNIEYYPTHIAGLPVAVNINCHVTRHEQAEL